MCGENKQGQLGTLNFERQYSPVYISGIKEPVSMISCGRQHTMAVSTRGNIWVMGSNENGELGIGQKYANQSEPVFLKELSFANITDISAGAFNMVLSSERQLYVWGLGAFGDFYTPHRVKFFKDLTI